MTIRQLLAGEDEIQRRPARACAVVWSFVVVRPFVPILAWSVVLAVASIRLPMALAGSKSAETSGYHPDADQSRHRHRSGDMASAGRRGGAAQLRRQIGAGTLAIPSPAGVKIGRLGPHHGMWDRPRPTWCAPGRGGPATEAAGRDDARSRGRCRHGDVQIPCRGRADGLSARRTAAGWSHKELPVQGCRRTTDFLALAGATIRSVAQGVIGIAVAQGLVIGIILKLAEFPAGLLPSP